MDGIKVGIIGGSGLGQALGGQTEGRRHEFATPFGAPSDAIIETEWAGVPVFFLSRHGPGHLLSPSNIPYRANLFALKQLGVTHILASGAAGSLREEFKPRELVVPDQVIDKTFARAVTFYEQVAVHVEMAEPFCPLLRQVLLDAQNAKPVDGATPADPMKVHERGCYVCMEGPAFSTRAESLMHRFWGGDLIGMTAMPEARLAREAEIAYALVAMVTDYDSWRPPAKPKEGAPAAPSDPAVLMGEIIENLNSATQNAIRLIRRAVELIAERRDLLQTSPALAALRLAIWSEKSRISPEEVQRLAPLWMKYF